jgi:hypothetical protein
MTATGYQAYTGVYTVCKAAEKTGLQTHPWLLLWGVLQIPKPMNQGEKEGSKREQDLLNQVSLSVTEYAQVNLHHSKVVFALLCSTLALRKADTPYTQELRIYGYTGRICAFACNKGLLINHD